MRTSGLKVVRVAVLSVAALALLASCGGDESDTDDGEGSAQTTSVADESVDEPTNGSDVDVCASVTQEQLDLLVPGLVLQEASSDDMVCEWTAAASVGAGSWLLLVQQYEGGEFYGGDIVDDPIPIDLCDRAFRADMLGDTIQFQADETVVQVSFTQIGVPDAERIDDAEASQRLEAFAREISQGVC